MPSVLKPKSVSEVDHRKAILSLRWLLVILACYLTLFSYVGTELFPVIFAFALAFSVSNFILMLVRRQQFLTRKTQAAITILDFLFVSGTLYFLRVPGNYLYVAFVAIFLLALVWRDLRLVLFSLFVVSLLFGVFSYFRLFGFQFDVDIERFLTLALFFVVAIFYVFLSETLTEDALISRTVKEDNRIAEVMVEMTRALSSSLNTDDVLYSIVSRLQEVLQAEECSIVRIDSKTGVARIVVRVPRLEERDVVIDLDRYPELKQAYASRQFLFLPDAKPTAIIVVPMVASESVLGLIYIRSSKIGLILSDANIRFFQTTFGLELARAQRHDRPLSLLMIDLDYLKQVNDRFGHPAGDRVIRTIAETIRSGCREIDFAARYGGEEFTVILPETPLAGAILVAERIRQRIAAERFPSIGNLTASVGVSNYPVNALNKEDLIRVADQALYVAKNGGRDRVAHFTYQMVTK